MIKPDSLRDIATPKITVAVQLALFRRVMKLVAIMCAVNVIVLPLWQGDHSARVWVVANMLGSSQVVMWVTLASCALLAAAVWVPRLRMAGGAIYACVMNIWAFMPWNPPFSSTLFIISWLGVALVVLGAETID